MKNEVKDMFMGTPGIEADVAEKFIEILSYPDEQFDVMYPFLKESLLKTYESEEFQKDMLKQMSVLPLGSVEESRAAIEDFLQIFDEDETISDKKKAFIHTMMESVLDVYARLLVSGRQTVKVKITKLNPDAIIPEYAHVTDAGCDVCAVEEVTIGAGETKIVKTGLAVAIPVGYEIQVRPRSGLSYKTKLRVANAPGTIDTDYRGEIGIIINNTGDTPYVVDKGMKIAQLLIAPTPMITWEEVDSVEELGSTDRGAGGFGSTGVVSKS